MTKRKLAFTLAETLIVMGIIGVVAALTLPNLNSSTGEKEKVAKLQKIYQNLSDAFGRTEAVYGPCEDLVTDGILDSEIEKIADRMYDFMKVSKYFEDYHYIPSDAFGGINIDANRLAVILADGSAIGFKSYSGDHHKGQMIAYVDIDGLNKGKSKLGSDVFEIIIYDANTGDKMVPAGLGTNDQTLTNECFKTGANCTAWVLQSGNMDYLKATNGSCPDNNTVLSWTNTSCK